MSHSKGEDNRCNIKGWWQDELVVESNGSSCWDYEPSWGLYIAGTYGGYIMNGEVRNFSYTQK